MKLAECFDKTDGVLMAHVYYGDPSPEFSLAQIKTLCANGVDIIEFGIPFSDPTADGKVFQGACQRALKAGMTPPLAIDGIRKIREAGSDAPIVVTSYYNPILAMGINEFVFQIKEEGATALIVPNLPLEESNLLRKVCVDNEIDLIFLVAPTTSDERLARILEVASGFLYIVNLLGVTGERKELANGAVQQIERIRKHTNLPLLAGFGISKKEHAESVVGAGANGAIVGSAFAGIYESQLSSPQNSLDEIGKLAGELKEGCNNGYKSHHEVV